MVATQYISDWVNMAMNKTLLWTSFPEWKSWAHVLQATTSVAAWSARMVTIPWTSAHARVSEDQGAHSSQASKLWADSNYFWQPLTWARVKPVTQNRVVSLAFHQPPGAMHNLPLLLKRQSDKRKPKQVLNCISAVTLSACTPDKGSFFPGKNQSLIDTWIMNETLSF